jgi:hypothetical protein
VQAEFHVQTDPRAALFPVSFIAPAGHPIIESELHSLARRHFIVVAELRIALISGPIRADITRSSPYLSASAI